MTSIELTEEHKSKILEMCIDLFPEYKFITFQEEAIMGAGWGYDFNNICFSEKSNSLFDIQINIHWFEFCILWLATIIYNKRKTNNFSILEYRGFLCQSVEHPIDFLYEEFKKLKK